MKTKVLSRILSTFIFVVIAFHGSLKAQFNCFVSATVDSHAVCASDNVTLSATGSCGILMSDDFENGAMGVGWLPTVPNPEFTNPCGLGPSGVYCWVGVTQDSTRILETMDFDVSMSGCEVEWYMRYGEVLTSGPCEDPDQPNEGVNLQWSADGGMTWEDFPGVNQYPQGQNHYTNNGGQPDDLLGTTTTPGTGGQWHPTPGGTHGGNFPPGQGTQPYSPSDNAFYWHRYSSLIPHGAITANTRFRWAQLSHSGAQWDSWGIDEVIIKCPTGTIDVLWSHGPTMLKPPSVILPDQGLAPYDTCFIVTISDTINSASDQICITVNPVPDSHFSISDTSLCTGDTTTITYTGQSSTVADYNWIIDGMLTSGQGPHVREFITHGQKNVSLSVDESGCVSDTTHKAITVHPTPTVSFALVPWHAYPGDIIYFDNQSWPVNSSWFWDFGDGNSSFDMSPTHAYDAPGTYPVSLFVLTHKGCDNELKNINLIIHPSPLSTFDNNVTNFDVSLTPNPSNGLFTLEIKGLEQEANLQVFSPNGQLIAEETIQPGYFKKTYILPSLTPGGYQVRIHNQNMTKTKMLLIH